MTTRPSLWGIGLLLIASGALCPASSSGQTVPAPRVDSVRIYLDRLEAFGYSGAASIAHRGEVLIDRGLGYADLETVQPFTPETGFFIASISKQFTAALILALEDRGLLKTGDVIGRYLSDVPPSMASMTLDHLLTHTSGLLRLDGESETLTDGNAILAAAVRAGVEYEPGSRFDYSNAGYAFLAALAERIARKDYETLSRELLFEPAGMEATSVVTEAAFWEDRPVSTGYNGFLPQGSALLTRSYGRELIGPAGVVTTASDMLRWERALHGGTVLSEGAKRKLFTPSLDNYAYGWSVWDSGLAGERVAGHDGHIMPEGFNCYYIRLLQSGTSIITLANRGDVALAERLAWALVAILKGQDPPALPEVGRSAETPVPGRYTGEDGADIRVHRIGDRYFVEPLNQSAANLFLEHTEAPTHTTLLVKRLLDSGDFDAGGAIANTIAAARRLADRSGNYRGHEVAYSVQEDGFLRTHLRHFVGADTLYSRIDLVDGEVVGGTDGGAFISGGRGLTPTLAYIGMAPGRGANWTAYDFWGLQSRTISIEDGALLVHERDGVVRLGAAPLRSRY